MNKNLIIAIVVVLVVVVGAFFIFKDKKALDVSFIQGDETELAGWLSDFEAFSQDDALAAELDQTFGDILDEGAAISADAALDDSSISQEASQADFLQTLNAFAADDAALQELDQISGEVSQ